MTESGEALKETPIKVEIFLEPQNLSRNHADLDGGDFSVGRSGGGSKDEGWSVGFLRGFIVSTGVSVLVGALGLGVHFASGDIANNRYTALPPEYYFAAYRLSERGGFEIVVLVALVLVPAIFSTSYFTLQPLWNHGRKFPAYCWGVAALYVIAVALILAFWPGPKQLPSCGSVDTGTCHDIGELWNKYLDSLPSTERQFAEKNNCIDIINLRGHYVSVRQFVEHSYKATTEEDIIETFADMVKSIHNTRSVISNSASILAVGSSVCPTCPVPGPADAKQLSSSACATDFLRTACEWAYQRCTPSCELMESCASTCTTVYKPTSCGKQNIDLLVSLVDAVTPDEGQEPSPFANHIEALLTNGRAAGTQKGNSDEEVIRSVYSMWQGIGNNCTRVTVGRTKSVWRPAEESCGSRNTTAKVRLSAGNTESKCVVGGGNQIPDSESSRKGSVSENTAARIGSDEETSTQRVIIFVVLYIGGLFMPLVLTQIPGLILPRSRRSLRRNCRHFWRQISFDSCCDFEHIQQGCTSLGFLTFAIAVCLFLAGFSFTSAFNSEMDFTALQWHLQTGTCDEGNSGASNTSSIGSTVTNNGRISYIPLTEYCSTMVAQVSVSAEDGREQESPAQRTVLITFSLLFYTVSLFSVALLFRLLLKPSSERSTTVKAGRGEQKDRISVAGNSTNRPSYEKLRNILVSFHLKIDSINPGKPNFFLKEMILHIVAGFLQTIFLVEQATNVPAFYTAVHGLLISLHLVGAAMSSGLRFGGVTGALTLSAVKDFAFSLYSFYIYFFSSEVSVLLPRLLGAVTLLLSVGDMESYYSTATDESARERRKSAACSQKTARQRWIFAISRVLPTLVFSSWGFAIFGTVCIAYFRMDNICSAALSREMWRCVSVDEKCFFAGGSFEANEAQCHFESIRVLDCSATPLTSAAVPVTIDKLQNLQKLNFSGSSLVTVGSEIAHLARNKSLEIVDLRYNSIRHVDTAFAHLQCFAQDWIPHGGGLRTINMSFAGNPLQWKLDWSLQTFDLNPDWMPLQFICSCLPDVGMVNLSATRLRFPTLLACDYGPPEMVSDIYRDMRAKKKANCKGGESTVDKFNRIFPGAWDMASDMKACVSHPGLWLGANTGRDVELDLSNNRISVIRNEFLGNFLRSNLEPKIRLAGNPVQILDISHVYGMTALPESMSSLARNIIELKLDHSPKLRNITFISEYTSVVKLTFGLGPSFLDRATTAPVILPESLPESVRALRFIGVRLKSSHGLLSRLVKLPKLKSLELEWDDIHHESNAVIDGRTEFRDVLQSLVTSRHSFACLYVRNFIYAMKDFIVSPLNATGLQFPVLRGFQVKSAVQLRPPQNWTAFCEEMKHVRTVSLVGLGYRKSLLDAPDGKCALDRIPSLKKGMNMSSGKIQELPNWQGAVADAKAACKCDDPKNQRKKAKFSVTRIDPIDEISVADPHSEFYHWEIVEDDEGHDCEVELQAACKKSVWPVLSLHSKSVMDEWAADLTKLPYPQKDRHAN